MFILEGDIAKALDDSRHDLVLEAIQARGIPDILAAAMMREVVRPRCKPKLGSTESKGTRCSVLHHKKRSWVAYSSTGSQILSYNV